VGAVRSERVHLPDESDERTPRPQLSIDIDQPPIRCTYICKTRLAPPFISRRLRRGRWRKQRGNFNRVAGVEGLNNSAG